MNPEEERQPQYQPDYLNQIAPVVQSNNIFSQKPIIFAALGLVFAIIIFFMSLSMTSAKKTDSLERLSARLGSTEGVAIDAAQKIKSSQLRALNSNLNIYLSNTIRELSPLLIDEDINIKKIDKKILVNESSDKILATLEDARLNAIYDLVYAREMAYQLETTMNLMKQIYKSTNRTKLKTFLDEAYKNLQPTQEQFSEFRAANG